MDILDLIKRCHASFPIYFWDMLALNFTVRQLVDVQAAYANARNDSTADDFFFLALYVGTC